MMDNVLRIGERIRIVSYGPFRGLRGTIGTVNTISSGSDKPLCFYLVKLEGAHIQEPIWFECDEVEVVSPQKSDILLRRV